MKTELSEEEKEWVEERIRDLPLKPYFIRGDILVLSKDDLERVVKRLKERAWMDRYGRFRLWYLTLVTYQTEEEYVWLKILLTS